MFKKNITFLLILFMCNAEFVYGLNTGRISRGQCKAESECIALKHCKSYMKFVSSFKKPLKPPVIQLLRERQCGFEGGFPKVCCSDISKNNVAAIQFKSNVKRCKKNNVCVSLKNCRPFMNLINKMGKPLKPLVVTFLKAQQCGFQGNYPTVCCSLLPKNVQILKHVRPDSRPIDFKEHEKPSSTVPDLKDIFSKAQTTTNPSVPDRDKVNKEKAAIINKEFDLSDFFDFTGSFGLFRRRRSNDGN